MIENIIKSSLKQLSNFLFLPVHELESLIEKHQLKESRKRSFFWIPFLLVCFRTFLNGKTRHKDRRCLYKKLSGISLSSNAFSDRLSALPPAFCQDLLSKIQPHTNNIGSPIQRNKMNQLVSKLLVEDASFFGLDNRLLNKFKAMPGSSSAGLKLYVSINVQGRPYLKAQIKEATVSDMKQQTNKGKNAKSIELRDRGWFSWETFVKWLDHDKYFISRIQKQINPQIREVFVGNEEWEKKRFQDLDLEGHKEVDFLVKPYRDSKGSVYRLKNGNVLHLRLKGKKGEAGQWFWYLYHLPNPDELSFCDIHALYRSRWQIEELFREMKQAFGGDRLRLRNSNSAQNHILMMLISYLLSKCYLRKIALAHRKSPDGFMLDTAMKGELRFELKEIILKLLDSPDLNKRKLRDISQAFCESAYSSKRANSYKKISRSKALNKMEVK